MSEGFEERSDSDADTLFLISYAKMIRPVAVAMNLLQGESKTYLGDLIPTIMGINKQTATVN
jgi:hypothetical protein